MTEHSFKRWEDAPEVFEHLEMIAGKLKDLNVIFPLERLKDPADEQSIGSVADVHYAFMGATDPLQMREKAGELAGTMKGDKVDAVLLVPV